VWYWQSSVTQAVHFSAHSHINIFSVDKPVYYPQHPVFHRHAVVWFFLLQARIANIETFWDVIPCELVYSYWSFGGEFFLDLHHSLRGVCCTEKCMCYVGNSTRFAFGVVVLCSGQGCRFLEHSLYLDKGFQYSQFSRTGPHIFSHNLGKWVDKSHKSLLLAFMWAKIFSTELFILEDILKWMCLMSLAAYLVISDTIRLWM
jgi:hypothetical protein